MPDGSMMKNSEMPEGPPLEDVAGKVEKAVQPRSEKLVGANPKEPDQPGEQYNASPEEQKQYDALMVAAMQLIYNEDRMPVLLQKLAVDKDHNLSKSVGGAAANIMQIITRSLERDHPNQQIGDDVLYNVGMDIVSELMEIAVAAGICPESSRDAVTEAALYEGLRAWGAAMEGEGRVTEDIKASFKGTLDQMGIQQTAPQGNSPPGVAPQGAGQGEPMAQPAQPPQGGIVNSAMGA